MVRVFQYRRFGGEALVLLLLLTPVAASARTWHVSDDGTGDAPTIQAALDSAGHGDTLVLADGVFSGPGNRDLDCGGKRLTIYSESGDPDLCVIDLGGSEEEWHLGFVFESEYPETASLSGVTIRNGYAPVDIPNYMGGALRIHRYTFDLNNCVFEGNTAFAGAAVFAYLVTMNMNDCRFTGNSGSHWWDSALMVTATGFQDFVANNCQFIDNGDSTSGHAVYCLSSDVYFTDCLIEGNGGGGVVVSGCGGLFEDCVIRNNGSRRYTAGGGVSVKSEVEIGTVTFRKCLIEGNRADEGGGAYVHSHFLDDVGPGMPARFDECTIVRNEGSVGSGVRLWAEWSWVEIANTIIALNDSSEAVFVYSYPDYCMQVSCTDIYGNPWGDWTGCIAGLLGVNGNFSADPMFCDASNGDFTLDAVSPCLEAAGCGTIGAYGEGCDVVTEVSSGAPSIPAHSFLGRSVPNPFNPATTVRFGLAADSEVSLTVHDVAGRLVRTLVAGPRRAGEFHATWNGENDSGRPAGSGTYFIRMVAGEFHDARKVILIR